MNQLMKLYITTTNEKTNAELKDELLDLRDEIRDEMNGEFQNLRTGITF